MGIDQTQVGQVDAGPAGISAPYVFPIVNEYKQSIIAGGLPPYAEMVRRGTRWKTFTATPFAPIAAYPTTLSNLEVTCNQPGYCFVVDTITAWQLLGTAATQVINVWGMVHTSVYSGNTALTLASANGQGSYASAAGTPLKTAITQTVVANGWEMFPGDTDAFSTAAATPGPGVVAQVDGRLIARYGYAVEVACTGSLATASSVQVSVSGYLVAITNSF